MDPLIKIFRVDEDEAARISASPDEPHLHGFEELIIGSEGALEHFIDFKTTTIEAPLVSFVTKGKVHRAIPKLTDGKCSMWVIRFKSEFIAETTFQLYAYFHDQATLKMQMGDRFDRLVTICEIIDAESKQDAPDLGVMRHLLSALFILIESERGKINPGAEIPDLSLNTTMQNFLTLLEANYHKPLGVEFYADNLFMTSRNLNLICKNVLQQTVSEVIETRKLIEAKNQLTHTDKNISEIGYDLGYNEKSYFTNVFKKRTGQTPSEFRDEMRRILSGNYNHPS